MKKLLIAFAFFSLLPFIGLTQTIFNYTGTMQTYVVPSGVTSIQLEAYGAEGGSSPVGFGNGGLGGYVTGEFAVIPGETLNIFVGGQGASDVTGGFNGGGNGVSSSGGGGASDVRQLGAAFVNRIIVAGGGGGGAYETAWPSGWGQGVGSGDGGAGGGLLGGNGLAWQNACQGGTGGSQSVGGASGGTMGIGGDGAASPGDTGGGGGGYYGGGGGGDCFGYNGAGGGGSGYTVPGALAVSHTSGIHSGEGMVVITPLCVGLNTNISATDLCDGELVTLSATSPSGATITWDNGVLNGVPFAAPIGTTNYTASSSDPGDCGFTVAITVIALPIVDGGADMIICTDGSNIALSGNGTADIYSWNNGVSDGIPFNPPIGVSTYIVIGTDIATGCTNSDTVEVNVATAMTVLGNTQDELFGNDGSIDINVTGGALPLSYQWDNGAGNVEDPSGLSAGNYVCVITDAFGCSITVGYTIYSQVDLDDLSINVAVYPNPTSGLININLEGDFNFTVFNSVGKKVLFGKGTKEEIVDMKDLENGHYILQINTDEQFYISQIIKN